MIRYTGKTYVKELSFARNLSEKYGEKILDTGRKTELDAVNTASKKVVKKTAEATRELMWNKMTKRFVNPKPVSDAHQRNYGKIVLRPEKWQKVLNGTP